MTLLMESSAPGVGVLSQHWLSPGCCTDSLEKPWVSTFWPKYIDQKYSKWGVQSRTAYLESLESSHSHFCPGLFITVVLFFPFCNADKHTNLKDLKEQIKSEAIWYFENYTVVDFFSLTSKPLWLLVFFFFSFLYQLGDRVRWPSRPHLFPPPHQEWADL